MLINKQSKQAGFTFTELMIALTINALLFGALITIFLANLQHHKRSINTDRLNQQLQSALDIMSDDIRRAGYWANANTDVGLHQNNNPFMAAGIDLTINPAGNCILFAYDHDNNGSLPAVSSSVDDERYGFRLSNGALQTRPPGAAFICTAVNTAWENATDPSFIEITNLSFVQSTKNITTGPGTKGISMRSIDISITGRLTSDNTVTRTLTQHVRIRNDKFIP